MNLLRVFLRAIYQISASILKAFVQPVNMYHGLRVSLTTVTEQITSTSHSITMVPILSTSSPSHTFEALHMYKETLLPLLPPSSHPIGHTLKNQHTSSHKSSTTPTPTSRPQHEVSCPRPRSSPRCFFCLCCRRPRGRCPRARLGRVLHDRLRG